jgi:hypothetical protein
MTDKRSPVPALDKLVGDIATGQTEDEPPEDGKNANVANLGRVAAAWSVILIRFGGKVDGWSYSSSIA